MFNIYYALFIGVSILFELFYSVIILIKMFLLEDISDSDSDSEESLSSLGVERVSLWDGDDNKSSSDDT